jgi:hypothetical protein
MIADLLKDIHCRVFVLCLTVLVPSAAVQVRRTVYINRGTSHES